MSDVIDIALAEDIGEGDLTTRAVVPEGAQAQARIEPEGAGRDRGAARGARRSSSASIRSSLLRACAARRASGARPGARGRDLGRGRARSSPAERVALNFLGRLSGVATLTARYVRAVEGTGVRILDTRKTTPGLRALEKEAVRAGGGDEPPQRPLRRDPRQGEPRGAGRRRGRGRAAARWQARRRA